jgi:hypothetical protein
VGDLRVPTVDVIEMLKRDEDLDRAVLEQPAASLGLEHLLAEIGGAESGEEKR